MAISFTSDRYFQTTSNLVLWNNQANASASFFFRYELTGGTSFAETNIGPVIGLWNYRLYFYFPGYSPDESHIAIGINIIRSDGQKSQFTTNLTTGVNYHFAVVWMQGLQQIYINTVASNVSYFTGNTEDINLPQQIGSSASGTSSVYTLDDVAMWSGYALTADDVYNLCFRISTPSEIATANLTAEWTLSGSGVPTIGDAGLNNASNHAYDFVSVAGSGSVLYSDPILIPTPAIVKSAQIGTSGKTIAIFFKDRNSADVAPTTEVIRPSIYKNGVSLGSLTNMWLTGYHKCVMYLFPDSTFATASDVITLSVPDFWMTTPVGPSGGMDNMIATNFSGRSVIGTELLPKTLRMGFNFGTLGVDEQTPYHIPRNLRYRLGYFGFGLTYIDYGHPVSSLNSANIQTNIIYLYYTGDNGLDSTKYPYKKQLVAVGWDDLNNAAPTTISIVPAEASQGQVIERTDLRNTGVDVGNGRTNNKARVYSVEPYDPNLFYGIRVNIHNDSFSYYFDNLAIYGEGDFNFTDGVPVVLNTSGDYGLDLCSMFRRRLPPVLGAARWMSATSGFQDNMSEPEEMRGLTDFTWSQGGRWAQYLSQIITARDYNLTRSPYIYSTLFGTSFTTTLDQDIVTAPAADTYEIFDAGYFRNAIAAPIIAGLTLTMPSGEIMRVYSVSGADPNAIVAVFRGAENTTPSPQTAGTIIVNNRLLITSYHQITDNAYDSGTNSRLTEFVTDVPHMLKSGHVMDLNWGISTITFTDGSTTTNFGNVFGVLVTGAHSFVINELASITTGPVTVAAPVDLTSNGLPANIQPTQSGFPFEYVAIATGKIPGCDLHLNISLLSSNTLVDRIADAVYRRFPPGRNVWIEMANEMWNWMFWSRRVAMTINSLVNGVTDPFMWLLQRTEEICQRFRNRFGSRSNEIKSLYNMQVSWPGGSTVGLLATAQSLDIKVDAIGVAPYIDVDTGPATIAIFNASDDEQAIDVWIHDLYYKSGGTTVGPAYAQNWPPTLDENKALIDDYNAATGHSCVLYAYEGEIETIVPAGCDNAVQRNHDCVHNPNWLIAQKDLYALYQPYFYRFCNFNYSCGWNYTLVWTIYPLMYEDYGRGDGSDGKFDNRLCLATPGKPNSKIATTNQDLHVVSVRGQAIIDWNRETQSPPKPRPLARNRH